MHFVCVRGDTLGVCEASGFRAGSTRGPVNGGDGRMDESFPAALRGKKKRELETEQVKTVLHLLVFFS